MDSENDLQQYVKRILADNPYKLVLSGQDGMRERRFAVWRTAIRPNGL